MNYSLLPTTVNKINISYTFSNHIKPIMSHSLIYFLSIIYKQIEDMNMGEQICSITKYVNPYDYIFSNVPESLLSVGKIQASSNIFYELIEIFNTCNICDDFFEKTKINSMHISDNSESSICLLSLLRKNKFDCNLYSGFDASKLLHNTTFPLKIDFFFFELNKIQYITNSNYFKNAVIMLYVILKNQSQYGVSILKIEGIFYKPIVDILYILTCAFDKVFIIKPTVSNIFSHERYIVCKKFLNNKIEILKKLEEIIFSPYGNISSIISNSLPYYFINKVEESNIVIGNQQLEALDQIINIIKNKNKGDKLETLKKNHIQKCIQWCEKYKVPYNKFMDKTNIFLNVTTSTTEITTTGIATTEINTTEINTTEIEYNKPIQNMETNI